MLNVALRVSVVPRMLVAPETEADTPFAFEYASDRAGLLITTPLVTVMSGKVAVRFEPSVPKVPLTTAGPWKPLPTSTNTLPVALNAITQGEPTVHVEVIEAPGSDTLTPGNGT